MITGGCYCGEVRYELESEPVARGQCHCRECQYISGGAENYYMVAPGAGFRFVKGEPKAFSRTDLPTPAIRHFCGTCGTHLTTIPGFRPQMVVIKVGTLDDPTVYGGPSIAIWTSDAQPFHVIPEGLQTFEGFPA